MNTVRKPLPRSRGSAMPTVLGRLQRKSWSNRSRLILGFLFVVALGRVASTYTVFNDTYDENNHITCGLEYWERGDYLIERQHPPLARAVLAAPAYFIAGLRLSPRNFLWNGEWASGPLERYWSTLSWARAGNLLFWAALLTTVYLWTRSLWNRRAALVAVLLCACSPTLLGHSAVACLDVAVAALTTCATWRLWLWFEADTAQGLRRSLWAGVACGLAVTAKFSALGFVAVAAVGLLAWAGARGRVRVGRRRFAEFACAGAVMCGTIWAVYRFDYGPVAPDRAAYQSEWAEGGSPSAALLARTLGPVSLPAPALFRGLIDALNHNAQGHRAFLLGEWSSQGRAAYFPIALATKATLPLLILAATGIALGGCDPRRRRKLVPPLILFAATLAVGIVANINIGVRHILPAFPALAMLAASLFAEMELSVAGRRRFKSAAVAAGLLAWHAGESLLAHPDYLPYFNQTVRGRAHRVLADSNLDWGQDLARLSEWMRENRVPGVMLWHFGQTPPERFGIRVGAPPPPQQGWLAVSVNHLNGMWGDTAELAALRRRPPDARIGQSIYLYRMTAAAAQKALAR